MAAKGSLRGRVRSSTVRPAPALLPRTVVRPARTRCVDPAPRSCVTGGPPIHHRVDTRQQYITRPWTVYTYIRTNDRRPRWLAAPPYICMLSPLFPRRLTDGVARFTTSARILIRKLASPPPAVRKDQKRRAYVSAGRLGDDFFPKSPSTRANRSKRFHDARVRTVARCTRSNRFVTERGNVSQRRWCAEIGKLEKNSILFLAVVWIIPNRARPVGSSCKTLPEIPKK